MTTPANLLRVDFDSILAHRDGAALVECLEECPSEFSAPLAMLADVAEEIGETTLAVGLRWCYRKRRFPFLDSSPLYKRSYWIWHRSSIATRVDRRTRGIILPPWMVDEVRALVRYGRIDDVRSVGHELGIFEVGLTICCRSLLGAFGCVGVAIESIRLTNPTSRKLRGVS